MPSTRSPRQFGALRQKMPKIEASEPVYNIFADLGFPDPETHLLKAGIVANIDRVIRRRRLTDAQAAKLFGLSQQETAKMLNGNFVGYPVERLRNFLILAACTNHKPGLSLDS